MKGNQMKKQMKKTGFTLVELLTVMAVIAVLIGILAPALNYVRKIAKDTSQRAQLHSISVSLDMFNGENGGYPDSYVRPANPTTGYSGATPYTVGAQHLAEALVGRDLLGFDPQSSWDATKDWTDKATRPVYGNGNDAADVASLARRKGPYLSQQNIEAYQIRQLYDGTITTVYDSNQSPAPVLTDCFRVKNVVIGGKTVMAGSPILYYKANTSVTGINVFPIDTFTPSADADFYGYIYNYVDNEELINLKTIKNKNTPHLYEGATGIRLFYDAIKNPKITSQPRPYNADTYILISAGYDGIYGTKDDITNFGE
jgi:prepilin-type N-terminal cleavage/methylation domain-containing protein